MAKNIQMYIKNSSGSYEELYPKTSANLITGILSVSNGGTGLSSALITSGTSSLTPNSSTLTTGTIYLVYE